jgi:serine/threonine protein phosphatase 1
MLNITRRMEIGGGSQLSMHNASTGSPRTASGSYPPGPEGVVVYIVGDIHGRLDLLLEMQSRIDRDRRQFGTKEIVEIYLGDYVDRGPDSAAVVSRLIERSKEVEARFLRGNHEQLLLDFIHGGDCLREWKAVGGSATLLSYGIAPDLLTREVAADVVRRTLAEKVPEEHRQFYLQTGSYIGIGPYLAVHAGLRPGVRLERQRTRDLLGIRSDFLDHTGDFGSIVIHGHTPVPKPDLRRNRINIDTGAFATNRLTCLRINADGAGILYEDGCRIAERS